MTGKSIDENWSFCELAPASCNARHRCSDCFPECSLDCASVWIAKERAGRLHTCNAPFCCSTSLVSCPHVMGTLRDVVIANFLSQFLMLHTGTWPCIQSISFRPCSQRIVPPAKSLSHFECGISLEIGMVTVSTIKST